MAIILFPVQWQSFCSPVHFCYREVRPRGRLVRHYRELDLSAKTTIQMPRICTADENGTRSLEHRCCLPVSERQPRDRRFKVGNGARLQSAEIGSFEVGAAERHACKPWRNRPTCGIQGSEADRIARRI